MFTCFYTLPYARVALLWRLCAGRERPRCPLPLLRLLLALRFLLPLRGLPAPLRGLVELRLSPEPFWLLLALRALFPAPLRLSFDVFCPLPEPARLPSVLRLRLPPLL